MVQSRDQLAEKLFIVTCFRLEPAAESAAGSTRKQVAMKSFSAKGSRDCTIRADDPQIEAKLLHDGKSEGVASPRDYDDLDSFSLRPA